MTTNSTQQPPLEDQLISELEGEIRVVHDRWSVGQIGWPDLIVAAGVLLAAVVLVVFIRRLIKRSTSSWDGPAASAAAAFSQLISIGVYLFAVAIVLAILGFSAGPVLILALLAVAAFVSIGPVLENLSSGLMIHLHGSCRLGDTVELDGLVGLVEEVNSRTIILIADDGRTFFYPNKQVLEHHVVNYSRLGRRRSSLSFRLGERSDIQQFAELAEDALRRLDCVLDDPPPRVVAKEFDGPRPVVDLRFWHRPTFEDESTAVDAVGRQMATLVDTSHLTLTDQGLVLQTPEPGNRP